jgi:hypothetical protein
MAEFMDKHIVNQVTGQEKQFVIEVDIVFA